MNNEDNPYINDLRKVRAFTKRALVFLATLPKEIQLMSSVMMIMDLAKGAAHDDHFLTKGILHDACDQTARNIHTSCERNPEGGIDVRDLDEEMPDEHTEEDGE